MSELGWAQDSRLDFVQTVALIVMTCVLIYAVWKIGRAMEGVIAGVREPLLVVIKENQETRRQLGTIWRRIEGVEERVAAAEATKALRRLEALEERIAAAERRGNDAADEA
jgi:hypothetical protein